MHCGLKDKPLVCISDVKDAFVGLPSGNADEKMITVMTSEMIGSQ